MNFVEQLTNPVEEIFYFVKPYFRDIDNVTLHEMISKHWYYGTIDAIYKEEKIVACVRWDISEDGKTFDILDLIISPKENGFLIMKHFIVRNWYRFPSVRNLKFSRNTKYPNRKESLYSLIKMFHIKERD